MPHSQFDTTQLPPAFQNVCFAEMLCSCYGYKTGVDKFDTALFEKHRQWISDASKNDVWDSLRFPSDDDWLAAITWYEAQTESLVIPLNFNASAFLSKEFPSAYLRGKQLGEAMSVVEKLPASHHHFYIEVDWDSECESIAICNIFASAVPLAGFDVEGISDGRYCKQVADNPADFLKFLIGAHLTDGIQVEKRPPGIVNNNTAFDFCSPSYGLHVQEEIGDTEIIAFAYVNQDYTLLRYVSKESIHLFISECIAKISWWQQKIPCFLFALQVGDEASALSLISNSSSLTKPLSAKVKASLAKLDYTKKETTRRRLKKLGVEFDEIGVESNRIGSKRKKYRYHWERHEG